MFKDVDINYIVIYDSKLQQPLQDLPKDVFLSYCNYQR